ncbi:PREDICTED: olfactory receptor 14A16-like [Chrysochloris asiatica]|uniref:Olfactory receptor n=1 Tax=Chrysochloris asiatica TaxID=185453 RepID=A0A9B0UB41_CHRAS|nr:PREDICTED: olfactory receptor 14A16-like [Chrysochloris asiatica]
MNNMSMVTEFILMGFAGPWKLQILQDGIFLAIYVTALLGNGLIITIISLDPCLHTPMYFFIRNLSLFDICLISAVVPKTIVNSLTHSNHISFRGCVIQVFLVAFSAATELLLLTVMCIDRYAAICHPLHYDIIMNRGTCVKMAFFSCLSGGLLSMIHTGLTFNLSYCEIIEIQQFFCDIPQLLVISCSEHITSEIVFIFISSVLDFCCFICIIISYAYIFSTVRKIPSTEGKSKAYSTCIPHLVVIILFLSTAISAYLKPILASASFTDLILSAFYIMLPPSLNPIIYGLRNKAMKVGLEKLITKFFSKENVFIFLQM